CLAVRDFGGHGTQTHFTRHCPFARSTARRGGTMTHLDETCRLVSEHMSEVLDGVADEQLLDHVAECERCRDARFEAKRHIEQIRRAGDDFVAPADLEQRVLAALDQAAAPLDETGQADELASPDETPLLEALPSDKERSTADAKRGRSVPRAWAVGLAGLGAAAAALALWLGRAGEPAPKTATGWSGTVSQVVSALGSARGLQICDAEATHCAKAEVGQRHEAGARLRTDGLTRAKLSMADGSAVYLDRATDFQLSARAGRGGKLLEGNLVADVQQIEGRSAEIALPTGRAEVLGTKFALRVTDDFARVDVSRGEVKLVDQQERHVSVTAGEGAELYAGKAPAASALASLEEAMAWSDESFIAAGPTEGNALRGLGELVAKKPGETGERENAVRLTRHAVKVRAAGNIVKTTVEEVFSNTTDEVLEGIFRFPLPPDAQIERLALEVDGELIEGAFVDREQASKIWRGAIVNSTKQRAQIKEAIIRVPGPWKDP